MKTLLILRHAKSAWGDLNLDDHERPLNARGRRATEDLGRWIRAQDLIPDEILCSTALRTQETVAGLELDRPVHLHRDLYLADPETMLDLLRSAREDRVMIVAHNPGIADFAHRLVGRPPDHSRFIDYPTGALTVVDFSAESWSEIGWKSGKCRFFVIPKELN